MAANTTPIFGKTPKQAFAIIAAANTARDGSGSLVTLFTAGADGSRIDFITFISAQAAVGASALRICRVYVTDLAGANPLLRAEISLAATTSSNTAVGAISTLTFTNGLLLESGQIVKVSQSIYGGVADTTHVWGQGSHY